MQGPSLSQGLHAVRAWLRQAALLLGLLGLLLPQALRAQGVELALLETGRSETHLVVDFATRLSLPRAVEDALQRGVPIHFVAEIALRRNRWYWRDERVASVSRHWRVIYQPLVNAWRVSFGGLSQSYGSLNEALGSMSRVANWPVVELSQIDTDKSYYLMFDFRLDTSQLPGPMQFGLGAGSDWSVGVSREIKVTL